MPDENAPQTPGLTGAERPGPRPELKRRARRSSPLGLEQEPLVDVPRANPLPSLRAVGIMVALMAAAIGAMFLFSRGCS